MLFCSAVGATDPLRASRSPIRSSASPWKENSLASLGMAGSPDAGSMARSSPGRTRARRTRALHGPRTTGDFSKVMPPHRLVGGSRRINRSTMTAEIGYPWTNQAETVTEAVTAGWRAGATRQEQRTWAGACPSGVDVVRDGEAGDSTQPPVEAHVLCIGVQRAPQRLVRRPWQGLVP